MIWFKRISAAILILLLIGGAVFWKKAMAVRALQSYASMFDPDHIDEGFRTFHEEYRSITIERAGPVAAFGTRDHAGVFPETYPYEGEDYPVSELLDEINWTGMIVLQGGEILHEAYARGNSAETHHIEMSVTKSLTSILIGIAHDQGHIPDLSAQVTEFVPELAGTAYDGVTIQQVLDMTSGVRYVEEYDNMNSDIIRTLIAFLRGSLDDYTTTMVREREPGTFNQYASVDTQVLSWILRRATGQDYADVFGEMLWAKIGAEADAEFLVDQEDQPAAFMGANLRLRDLARVGQMLANGGVSMTGERVVSQEWLAQSTTPDTEQSRPGEHAYSDYILGYKNQWWIPVDRDVDDYTAIGVYGQFLYINPHRNVVIAMNSAYPDYNDYPEIELEMLSAMQAIARHVNPDR